MDVFEITIQRGTDERRPIIAEQSSLSSFSSWRSEGLLKLDRSKLLSQLTVIGYGTVLGEAVFQGTVRDAFIHARAQNPNQLRVLLNIEDEELKNLRWERLCAPFGSGGGWDFLALHQTTPLSLYIPSSTERVFTMIGSRDLQALIAVANPTDLPRGLERFDDAAAINGVRSALGTIKSDVLTADSLAAGQTMLDLICERLTAGRYTLLHIICHGQFQRDSGETVLYLTKNEAQGHHEGEVDASNLTDAVTAQHFIQRLNNVRHLPHFAFLASCETATAEAEEALGGLAQRMIRDLGLLAVAAMTDKVSVTTAQALTESFYKRLRAQGAPDLALVEACAGLAENHDITVPALFSRLGGRPLFSDSLDRPLTNTEIGDGLERVQSLLPVRAPVLVPVFLRSAGTLRGMLGTDVEALSPAARDERREGLAEVNKICEEAIDISFPALALGQPPPTYNDRCPFPGLFPFRPEDQDIFFGREPLVRELVEKISNQPFLAVLGRSGSGKSSLVLAGVIPALKAKTPGLHMLYMTPGNDPVPLLETKLLENQGAPRVLVVDQFEELFTQCADKKRRAAFIEKLLSLPGQLPVIITMRIDFEGDCAPYPQLVERLDRDRKSISPMTTQELRSSIEQQASAVGLRFEADLASTLMDDVSEEADAMALLQHALWELWNRRHGRWLLAEEYRAIGKVERAIAERANKLYESLSPQEQERMQDIFLRLTRIDEDAA
jgi:energy-coupling factor transporter ATP-binding protein EcfA2